MTRSEKFLTRIGLHADTKTEYTYDFLKLIQFQSVLSIPYENLDILAGKPISLNYEDIFEKIIERQRGGFCFELNALLSRFFKDAGFEVKDCLARYLRRETSIPVRRHRVLCVTCGETSYLSDIGVGQAAPRYPLEIVEDVVQYQFGEQYKFEKDDTLGWVLYDYRNGEWRKYLAFTEEPQLEVDFIQPSFYCEKHPDSIFNKTAMVAIKTPDGRKTINNRDYKEFIGNELAVCEEKMSDERFYERLGKDFHIKL